jgi:hypothetical protein
LIDENIFSSLTAMAKQVIVIKKYTIITTPTHLWGKYNLRALLETHM